MNDIGKFKKSFETSLNEFVASLSEVVATEDGSWTIKGFIDAYKTFIPFLLIRKLFLKF
nr:hypothetical protein [Fibrobacter intestinalis]